MLRKTQIHFTATAQMAQTEEFMFQNVAYRTTVYRTGVKIDLRTGIISFIKMKNMRFVICIVWKNHKIRSLSVWERISDDYFLFLLFFFSFLFFPGKKPDLFSRHIYFTIPRASLQ